MRPTDYCLHRLGGPGTSLYYSLRHLPPEPRAAVTALHALVRELSDVPVECQDPGLARIKLVWWREQILRAGEIRAEHPVTQALAPLLRDGRIDPAELAALAGATEASIAPVRFAGVAEIEAHYRQTAGRVAVLVARILGANAHQQERAADLGTTHALAQALIEAGADARRNRLYFAGDELAQFGIAEADVLAARETGAWLEFVANQHTRLLARYAAARDSIAPADLPALLPELVMADLHEALLAEIRAAGYRVLSQRIALTPLRRLWIAWRTRRRLSRSKPGSRLG